MHLLEVTYSLIYAEIGFKLNNCYDYKLPDGSRVDPLGGRSTILFDNRGQSPEVVVYAYTLQQTNARRSIVNIEDEIHYLIHCTFNQFIVNICIRISIFEVSKLNLDFKSMYIWLNFCITLFTINN